MKLQTKYFGEIEVVGDKVITFPHGIIAFEDKKKYVLIDSEDEKLPISWLQSIDDPNLAFVVMDPFVFKKDYEFDIPQDAITELGIKEPEDVHILVILVIPENIRKMTANLLAPLVININTKQGKQVILDDTRYTTKHLIMEELRKSTQGGIKDAGSD
jgi:flagellar assembly factor FliW